MNEIKCPNCGKVFSVDEASYASVVSQVRNKEFMAEVQRRAEELERQQQLQRQSDKLLAEQGFQRQLNEKDKELERRNAEIARLQEQMKGIAQSKQAEMEKILSAKDVQLSKKEMEIAQLLAAKDAEILQLQGQIAQSQSQTQVAVLKEQNKATQLIQQKDNEIASWKGRLDAEKNDSMRREQDIRQGYELQLRQKQEMVDYYKDLKTRMSTKMVGETLEAHCNTLFNTTIRPIMPYAYFEKDNDASGGSKGDFIFRDFDGDFEYISIMFEMKNEMDETATKHITRVLLTLATAIQRCTSSVRSSLSRSSRYWCKHRRRALHCNVS